MRADRSNPPRRLRAFTLVELMVAVGIIVLVLALAIPSVQAMLSGADYPATLNTLSALLATGQASAAAGDTVAGIRFGYDTVRDMQWAVFVTRAPSGVDMPDSLDRFIKIPGSDTFDMPRRNRVAPLSAVIGTGWDADDYGEIERLCSFYVLFDSQGVLAHGVPVWIWDDHDGDGNLQSGEISTGTSERGLAVFDRQAWASRSSNSDKRDYIRNGCDPLYINRFTGTLIQP